MKRVIVYRSIDQFEGVCRNVQHAARYMGQDENDEDIYDPNPKYPVVIGKATEKIHGTNAGVCFNEELGFWVQSKTAVLEIGKDNAGCAFANTPLEPQWVEIIRSLADEYDIDLKKKIIAVYFEWCGKGIQKSTAVAGLEKRAMVFSYFKVAPKEHSEDEASIWLPTTVKGVPVSNEDVGIYHLENFPTWEFEINFAPHMAKMSQNAMVDLVLMTVEPSSPVGEQFGIKGNVGEGVVVAFLYKDNLFQFKVKGDKHSNKTCLRDFHTDVHTQARIIRFMKEQDSTNFDYAFGDELVITAENGVKFSLVCDQSVNPVEGRASVSYGSKVKMLKHVDNERLQKINEVAQEVSKIWRLDQMFTEANDLLNGGMADIKNMGKFMKLVNADIVKEESDLIREAGLEPKEVFKSVSIISRGFYVEKLEELAFES